MVSAGSGGMETDDEKKKINDDEKKKINDDVVVFLRKRSETEAPRYSAHLKTYVTLQQKRRRADAARRHSEHAVRKEKRVPSGSRKRVEIETKDKGAENTELGANDERMRKSRVGEGDPRRRSLSRSCEPSDGCCRRRRRPRRRSCRRRRRRRSGRRRRRRRSSRRRRRRSCSRRRRRRSCRRRRQRRRRCR
ncbi:uncharacterized protein ACR2FA_009778 [Aphomia sociella]